MKWIVRLLCVLILSAATIGPMPLADRRGLLPISPRIAQADEPEGDDEAVDAELEGDPVESGTEQIDLSEQSPSTAPAEAVDPESVTDLAGAVSLYNRGQYDAAEQVCRRLLEVESPAPEAATALAETLAIRGRYADALAALDAVAEADRPARSWQVRAEILATLGRYDHAVAAAQRALDLDARLGPAIVTLGRLYETLGRREEAIGAYRTIAAVADHEPSRRDPAALVAIGQAMDRLATLTGQRVSDQADNILNNYLRRAYTEADEHYWPAAVAAGDFLRSKHRPRNAALEYRAANEINPNIPAVAAGMAGVLLEQWQFEQAEDLLRQGLAINPHDPALHVMRAQVLLQWRKFDQVSQPLDEALAVNPNHLEALSLKAALHLRRFDESAAEPFLARIEQIHGGPWAEGLVIIGDWLSAGRQFDQAERYLTRAAELAPHMPAAPAELGVLYMQRGYEDRAAEMLRRAHEIDSFRYDVVNYLRLIDYMDRHFVQRETEHFLIKVHGEHDRVLLDQVAGYMESIHPEICRDLDYEPTEKTVIEIFPSHRGFSMRIAAKGWIGTVGASTGRVIALVAPHPERSPQFGRFNWATVLRHEYAHTITLEMTGNRIPHWYTEALAVFQQPDRRNFEAVQLLVSAVREDRLFTVEEMDWGFIRPRRAGDRSLAYAQAEWTAEYIIAAGGYGKIIEMLHGFRDGLSQAEVFDQVLGVSEEQFNREFRQWAHQQVRRWGFDPSPAPSMEAANELLTADREDPAGHAALAAARLAANNPAAAAEAAQEALRLDQDNPGAIRVLLRIAIVQEDWDEARRWADRLEQVDPTSALAARVRSQLALQQRRWAEAIVALEQLKARQPLDPWSYEQLAGLYRQLGQAERALPNLVEINRHNMRDPTWPRQIAETYRRMGDSEQAETFYRQVLWINPYDSTVYQTLAAMALRERDYDAAIRHAANATDVAPRVARAWAVLAQVCYFSGQATDDVETLRRGLDAAQRALQLDPASQAGQIKQAIEQLLNS